MVFDTWGGTLTPRDYKAFSLAYMQRIVDGLTREADGRKVPVIVFTKGGGQWLEWMADTGCDALGLDWTTDIADAIFGVPTRLGRPRGIGGLTDVVNNPMYATGVGLVIYGARKEPEKKFRIRDRNIFNSLISRMKKWFKDVI